MQKPSDLTKAELLQVVEMLAEAAGEYYLDRVLGRIEMQRNDAHYEKVRKLIDEERQHSNAYFELLRPYEGRPLADIPLEVVERAQVELDKARAAGREWDRLNGIKRKKKQEEK
nr:MAG TPA: Putative betaine aldehyde dehydrogenase [Caudoviricetes sp.]